MLKIVPFAFFHFLTFSNEFDTLSNEKSHRRAMGLIIQWSRGESNSRPNKEQLSFLRAYSVIDFRQEAGHGQPNSSLASEVSLRQ
jgi:hypothetical protein